MSSCVYNGIALSEPLDQGEYTKTPVFDGPTYLFTKHRLRVRAVYNPKAVSYAAPAGMAPPLATPGLFAPTTEAAVRHQLAQARQSLIYTVGNTVMLQSPAAGASVDAANGPFPTVHSIVEQAGAKTFQVDFSVETYINEASLYVATPSVLLSHRWKMSHHINPDAFLTRIIIGHAVFRSDRLITLGAKPDDYRAFCFHPIPVGFQRVGIDAEVDEDNLAFDYTITDRQRALCIKQAGITRIEGHYTQRQTSVGFEAAAWQAGGSLLNIGSSALQGIGLGDKAKIGDVAGFVNSASGEVAKGLGNVPRRFHEMSITCWGSKGQTPSSMCLAARSIITTQLTATAIAFSQYDYSETHPYSMDEVCGSARVVLSSGPVASGVLIGRAAAAGVAGGQAGNSAIPTFTFGPSDEVLPLATYTTAIVAQPLNADNARGSYLGSIVAAALQAPNAIPSAPTDPPQFSTKVPP